MQSNILKRLRERSQGIQMDDVHSLFGLSRQEFSAQIKTLMEAGYVFIQSTDEIKLVSSPDAPFPWEFPEYESKIHYFQNVKSTMINARELAESGAPHYTVVIAERQDGGRGRLDRTWISSDGGLYLTLVLRPDIPPALCYRINFIASLVLAQTLRKLYEIEAMVKWPNDILVNEKKVSGMLSEMALDADKVDYVNLGIGINVNNDPTDKEPRASSIRLISGQTVSRTELLRTFLKEFEQKLSRISLDKDIIAQWKKVSLTIGRKVTVATTKDTFSGLAVDVDDQGALILEKQDGSQEAVIYGDCFLEE